MGARSINRTMTDHELQAVTELLGCSQTQTINCLTNSKTFINPPPSVPELVKLDSDEKHGTGSCDCCAARVQRERLSNASYLEAQRAQCIKRHTLIAPRKSSTPYVGKSIPAQDASTTPPFADWRYALLHNQLTMDERCGVPLPPMHRAIIFGHVLALPVLHPREVQIMLIDSAGESFDILIRQTDAEVAQGFQARIEAADQHFPVNMAVGVRHIAFKRPPGKEPLFTVDLREHPDAIQTFGTQTAFRRRAAQHVVRTLPMLRAWTGEGLPPIRKYRDMVVALDLCVTESQGMYATLLQNMAQAYIQLEDWRMAAAFAFTATRVEKRHTPLKACMRLAMALDRMGLQLGGAWALFQVEPEDRKDTYKHLRSTLETKIAVAKWGELYFHLVQMFGKRQAVAGLYASILHVFSALRMLDYRTKGPRSFTDFSGVAFEDIPEDLKKPELPGDEGTVGRLNQAAKDFYKQGNMLAAVATWRAALMRLQVWQSGESPASFLAPCLQICSEGIRETMDTESKTVADCNGEMEAFLDLFAAMVVEHLPADKFAAKSTHEQCSQSALWSLIATNAPQMGPIVKEMSRTAQKRIKAAMDEVDDPYINSTNDAANALAERIAGAMILRDDKKRPKALTGRFARDTWADAYDGKIPPAAEVVQAPAPSETPAQNGHAHPDDALPAAASSLMQPDTAAKAVAAVAGAAPAAKVGGKRSKAGKSRSKNKASGAEASTKASALNTNKATMSEPMVQWWMPDAMG